MVFARIVFLSILSALTACSLGRADGLDEQLDILRGVKQDGSANRDAAAAWQQIVRSEPRELLRILVAIDGASPLAANWLRSAVDAIAERTMAGEQPLPLQSLERFALDTQHDGRARRLAFEWLRRSDESLAEKLIPNLLHDPSVEFRRDAVERLVGRGRELLKTDRQDEAAEIFEQALVAARDTDQIDSLVDQLRRLERTVNLPEHFGFLMQWQIVGPFDNTGREGFAAVYPPESEFDPDRAYAGKSGEVRWTEFATTDDYGLVDFNRPLGNLKETVAYARSEFVSERKQEVELRLGCKNAWKVWLNGDLLFGRDEYHRGKQIDQYRMPAKLRQGPNAILVKVCQNEETETWTVEWEFQLRVCDATGTAILSADRK